MERIPNLRLTNSGFISSFSQLVWRRPHIPMQIFPIESFSLPQQVAFSTPAQLNPIESKEEGRSLTPIYWL